MRPLVGNDVVDLCDPDNARSFRRPGYVERVCGAREREALGTALEPERLFWSLWAAKEAAYKLFTKLGVVPGFAHRELEVAADLRSVRFEGRRVALELISGEGFVHALATLGPGDARARVGPAEGDPSRGARRLLADLVASMTECASAELAVERLAVPGSWDGFGPPAITRAGARLDLDVSLSHDGRFVAAAAVRPQVAPATLSLSVAP